MHALTVGQWKCSFGWALGEATACALAVQIHTSIILAAATSSRCLKTTFRTSLRRFTDFLFGCSSIAWKFTGRPYLGTQHTWSSAGKGTALSSCPSPSAASRHACWCYRNNAASLLESHSWSQKSTKQFLSVFPFPLSAPKESFVIRFICHLFCEHLYCLLWAPGVKRVRHTPQARQNEVCKGSSHKGTAPGRQLYILTSPGISACTLVFTHLRTDSTKTLKAFTWIQATNASLKFTFSQRSKGPCEKRTVLWSPCWVKQLHSQHCYWGHRGLLG